MPKLANKSATKCARRNFSSYWTNQRVFNTQSSRHLQKDQLQAVRKENHTAIYHRNQLISMASSSTSSFMAFVIGVLLIAAPHVDATITCEQVTIWLTPCISYGVIGGTVLPACCDGLKALTAAAKTTEDRRTKCNCIKNGAAMIPGLDYDRVNKLPGICGTSCNFTLTHDLDCSKYVLLLMILWFLNI